MTNAQQVLALVIMVGTVLAGLCRVLVLLNKVARTHQQLVHDVAGLVQDGPKLRRRIRRVERELGLRPRTRTTTTVTQTTEGTPDS